jgi:hypothetical protein
MKRAAILIVKLCTVGTLFLLSGFDDCGCGSNGPPSCSVPVPVPGVYEVNYSDSNGNTQNTFLTSDGSVLFIPDCSQIVSQNSADPSFACNLICPADITVISHHIDLPSIAVNFATPGAANCSAGEAITCSPASGSGFAVSQEVNCSAADGHKIDAACSFRVNIFQECLQDDQDPNVSLAFSGINAGSGGVVSFTFRCDGDTFSGPATWTHIGNTYHLQLYFNPSIQTYLGLIADFDPIAKTAKATLTKPDRSTCTLNDSNTDHGNCGFTSVSSAGNRRTK